MSSDTTAAELMRTVVHDNHLYRIPSSVKKVFSFMRKIYFSAPNKDTTVTLMEFSSGTLGYLGSNYVSPPIYYPNLYRTKANSFFDRWKNDLYIQKSRKIKKEKIKVKKVDTVLEELEEFAGCIRKNKKPEIGGKEALRCLITVGAAIKSNETGKSIEIKEITE